MYLLMVLNSVLVVLDLLCDSFKGRWFLMLLMMLMRAEV